MPHRTGNRAINKDVYECLRHITTLTLRRKLNPTLLQHLVDREPPMPKSPQKNDIVVLSHRPQHGVKMSEMESLIRTSSHADFKEKTPSELRIQRARSGSLKEIGVNKICFATEGETTEHRRSQSQTPSNKKLEMHAPRSPLTSL